MYSSLLDSMESIVKSPDHSATFLSPSALTRSSFKHMLPYKTSPTGAEFYSSSSISPYISPIHNSIFMSPPFLMSPPPLNLSATSSYDSAYLQRLRSNPMFRDLQNLLAQECLHMQVPTNLINSSWNSSASCVRSDNSCDVFSRHMKLQEQFLELRSQDLNRAEGLNLESNYSAEVGQIEVGRYQALCAAGLSDQHRNSVNFNFDHKRLTLIQSYEIQLQQLISKTNKHHNKIVPRAKESHVKTPLLTRDRAMPNLAFPHRTVSVPVVARQLAFTEENIVKQSHKADSPISIPDSASSPECLELDCSLDEEESSFKKTKTILGDSGICPDDTCSVTSSGSSDMLQEIRDISGISNDINYHSEPGISDDINSCSDSCNNLDDSTNTASGPHSFDTNKHQEIFHQNNSFKPESSDFMSEDFRNEGEMLDQSENIVTRKQKRKLDSEENCRHTDSKKQKLTANQQPKGKKITIESTNILTAWYSEHIRYPYPSDLEVEQLATLTGLSHQQIKKWMANKRVRNFNTLSITGNQHPIKFKFKGHRDSGKSAKLPTYQQLHPEARRILNEWYDSHLDHPYPSDQEKTELAIKTGISEQQVKSWFANKRSRANNTRRQVPNYFIKKYPEYTTHVQMVSLSRELARKSKRNDLDCMLDCVYR